jgi:hypothetical protein
MIIGMITLGSVTFDGLVGFSRNLDFPFFGTECLGWQSNGFDLNGSIMVIEFEPFCGV